MPGAACHYRGAAGGGSNTRGVGAQSLAAPLLHNLPGDILKPTNRGTQRAAVGILPTVFYMPRISSSSAGRATEWRGAGAKAICFR